MDAPFHYRAFIARLQEMGLRGARSGRGMLFQCPAHADRNPSMKVDWSDEGPDHPVLVDCKAGCKTKAVCEAMGDPTMASLFPAREAASPFVGGIKRITPENPEPVEERILTPVEQYVYTDEKGEPLYIVHRLVDQHGKKDFRQCRPDGTPNIRGVRRVLYQLHKIQGKESVLFVEGEKDVATCRKLGLPATTNMGGANAWEDEYVEQLVAAGTQRLTILPDNDTAGIEHAHVVAAAAHAKGISVRVVELPGLPPKGDVTDWVAAGHTREELIALVTAAKFWNPGLAPVPEGALRARRGDELDRRPPTFLIEGLIPAGWLGSIAGRDKRGKTLFGLEIAKAILTGEKLLGEFEVKKRGKVLLVLLDDPENLVSDRLDKLGILTHDNLLVVTENDVDMQDQMKVIDMLADLIRREQPVFVLIDALYLFVPRGGKGDNANSSSAMTEVMAKFNRICNENVDSTVCIVIHNNKADTDLSGSGTIRNMLKWILIIALPRKYEKDIQGGRMTPDRVLQLDKLKTGAPNQWGLRIGQSVHGGAEWQLLPLEEVERKDKKVSKAERFSEMIEWLRFFLEDGPKTRLQIQEAGWEAGKYTARELDKATEQEHIEKYHPNNESPWYWRLRQERDGDKVRAVQPKREGEGAQRPLPGTAGDDHAGA